MKKQALKDVSVAATVHAHRHEIAEWWCRICISNSEPLNCRDACDVLDFFEKLIGEKAVKDAWKRFQKAKGTTAERLEAMRKGLDRG